MLDLLLVYKAITVLMTIKITKMALVNMYLTIGGVKIRFLGYTPEFFSQWPHAALWGLTFDIYSGNRRRQLYWSNIMDWPLPPNTKRGQCIGLITDQDIEAVFRI